MHRQNFIKYTLMNAIYTQTIHGIVNFAFSDHTTIADHYHLKHITNL